MTRQALAQGATFIIWPESSTPFYFEQDLLRGIVDPPAGERGQGDAADRQRSGRAGRGLSRAARSRQPRSYNAAFLVQPDGRIGAVYRKMHLVPFGEYVPLQRLLFFVGPIVEATSDFVPGTEAVLLPVGVASGQHRDLL